MVTLLTGTAKKNGAGLIFFDVLPNRKYYVFGTGTKIPSSGFAYSNGALVKEIKAPSQRYDSC